MKGIVYGNVARYFGKKREEDGHTHQWTVYLKPYDNQVRPTQHLVSGIGPENHDLLIKSKHNQSSMRKLFF